MITLVYGLEKLGGGSKKLTGGTKKLAGGVIQANQATLGSGPSGIQGPIFLTVTLLIARITTVRKESKEYLSFLIHLPGMIVGKRIHKNHLERHSGVLLEQNYMLNAIGTVKE